MRLSVSSVHVGQAFDLAFEARSSTDEIGLALKLIDSFRAATSSLQLPARCTPAAYPTKASQGWVRTVMLDVRMTALVKT